MTIIIRILLQPFVVPDVPERLPLAIIRMARNRRLHQIQSDYLSKLNRREFLSALSLLFGSSAAAELFRSSCSAQPSNEGSTSSGDTRVDYKGRKFSLGPWTGDDFTRGHQMRDAHAPVRACETHSKVDFLIVGGGMAGLCAAHYLKDHDFLLLEQYAEAGGQSRGGSRQGVDFSYGAAYIGAPENDIGQLLADLNLKPIELDTTRNSWQFDSLAVPKPLERLIGVRGNERLSEAGSAKVYFDFKNFEQQARPVWKMIDAIKDMDLNEDLKKLDRIAFTSCLTEYSPEFISILDSVSRSYNCLGVDKISALAGYFTMQDLYASCCTFPGGNSAITRAVVKSFSSTSRIKTNTFVWSVDVTESGVTAIYSDDLGHMHEVKARHAIVTIPPMIAARVITSIDNVSKASMLAFRYGSYLVANCFFSQPVYEGVFDNWYSRTPGFTDIVVAESAYRKTDTYLKTMGQVLTVYQPYVPGSEGRTLLMNGSRPEIASGILDQLSSVSHNLDTFLDSIVLSRWGHAMPVMNVGYFERMRKLGALPYANLSLAHSSTQGATCAESAVAAARKAANQALKIKAPGKN